MRLVTAEWMQERAIPEPNSGCWFWVSSLDRGGYGRLSIGNYTRSAHRTSYELHCGPVPDGMELDHLCRVRCCINPAHLEPVTRRENIRRSKAWDWNKSKTHCPAGHPYEGDNLRMISDGRRMCKECQRASNRASKMRAYYKKKEIAA